jgi:hypothetical protein
LSNVLELSGFPEFERLLEQMPELSLAAAEVAMEKTMAFLMSVLPPYPPAVNFEPGVVARAWTDKQRRFFFAALRSGRIKLPYRRTGLLGQRFTTEVRREADSVEGEWGTNDLKAPWVVGPDYPGEEIRGEPMYQARIHAGRWWQFGSVFDEHKDAAMNLYETEFFVEFKQRVAAFKG